MCIPPAAGGLRPADGAQLVEHLVRHRGDPAHARQVGVGHRVQVDPPLVRMLDVGAPRVPGWNSTVDICTAQMTLASSVTHSSSAVRPKRGKVIRTVCSQSGAPRGIALLVDLLAVDAAREAVQHARPLAQRADDPVADAHVVAGQVELGLAPRREVHPVGLEMRTVRSPTDSCTGSGEGVAAIHEIVARAFLW